MNFAKEIVRRAFLEGFDCRVDNGRGTTIEYENFLQTWEAVTAVDKAHVYINACRRTETLRVINNGRPEESAADFSRGGFIEEVWDEIS